MPLRLIMEFLKILGMLMWSWPPGNMQEPDLRMGMHFPDQNHEVASRVTPSLSYVPILLAIIDSHKSLPLQWKYWQLLTISIVSNRPVLTSLLLWHHILQRSLTLQRRGSQTTHAKHCLSNQHVLLIVVSVLPSHIAVQTHRNTQVYINHKLVGLLAQDTY